VTSQTVNNSQPLTGLANQLHDGDVQALADSINRFFQGVAADLSPLDDNSTSPSPEVIPDEFIISLKDIECRLSQINIHKAPGPDRLPNWLLRDFSSCFAGPVGAIYSGSVRERFVPSWWKEANVMPVPKVQSPKAIKSDLHPISLTATLGKVLESFVRSWILDQVGNNLVNWQYAGLRQCSTTHALVDMLHHWHAAIDKSQSVHSVFIDFAKAFNHIDHNILVDKLVALSLPDVIMRWICAFL